MLQHLRRDRADQSHSTVSLCMSKHTVIWNRRENWSLPEMDSRCVRVLTGFTNRVGFLVVLLVASSTGSTDPCRAEKVADAYDGQWCPLTGTGVRSIPVNVTALRMVAVEGHRLEDVSLPPLPFLKVLEYDVTHRNITDADGPFRNLRSLDKLQLFHSAQNARHFRFGLTPGLFSGLNGLTWLILSDLGLELLPDGVFSGLENLKRLELNLNRLDRIPQGTFSVCCHQLYYLTLSRNMISDLRMMSWSGLQGLRTLDLSGNRLVALKDRDFAGIGNVTEVDLSLNELERIEPRAFGPLKSLQSLYLNRNRLNFSDVDGQRSRSSSRMGPRGSRRSPFWGLSQLETLEISDNHITSIYNRTFEGLVKLQNLDLSENFLHTVQEGSFKHLTRLVFLNLRQNRIMTLGEQFRGIFSRLSTVDLSFNPWHCDCDLHWLVKWLRSATGEETSAASTRQLEVENLENTRCSTPIADRDITKAFDNRSGECERMKTGNEDELDGQVTTEDAQVTTEDGQVTEDGQATTEDGQVTTDDGKKITRELQQTTVDYLLSKRTTTDSIPVNLGFTLSTETPFFPVIDELGNPRTEETWHTTQAQVTTEEVHSFNATESSFKESQKIADTAPDDCWWVNETETERTDDDLQSEKTDNIETLDVLVLEKFLNLTAGRFQVTTVKNSVMTDEQLRENLNNCKAEGLKSTTQKNSEPEQDTRTTVRWSKDSPTTSNSMSRHSPTPRKVQATDALQITNENLKTFDNLLSSVTTNLRTLDSLLLKTSENINTLNVLLQTTIHHMGDKEGHMRAERTFAPADDGKQISNNAAFLTSSRMITRLAASITIIRSLTKWTGNLRS